MTDRGCSHLNSVDSVKQQGADGVAKSLGLDPGAKGLVGWDAFDAVLSPGDVILLISGGHGFEVLEDLNMVEVKQGPYTEDRDKKRFEAKLPADLKFNAPSA